MLNSIIYKVEFEVRYVNEYIANTISENMLTQVKGIIDVRKEAATAVTKDDICIITKCGQKKIWKTTVGWQLMFQWRDQFESWIHLKNLKEYHPIEVAEFAKT